MKYTKKQIQEAYLKWHTNYRLNPQDFVSDDLTKSVEQLSKEDTDYLISLID